MEQKYLKALPFYFYLCLLFLFSKLGTFLEFGSGFITDNGPTADTLYITYIFLY